MPVLIVVAHPDDEVLGVGGTAFTMAQRGDTVTSCILVGSAAARADRPAPDELAADTKEAQSVLGAGDPIIGHFPNMKLNTVPHIDVVKFIERAMLETQPDVVFTHHPGDINDDHRQTALACQAAARMAQRRDTGPRLRGLYFMEVLSATDWAFRGGSQPFVPDTFVEIGPSGLQAKLAALEAYRGVMRPYPHPRSREAIEGLALYRGAQAGMDRAEAFASGFQTLAAG